MTSSIGIASLLVLFLTQCSINSIALAQLPGTWEVLLESAGIASMHTAVTHFNTVVLLDRTDIGPSNLTLPNNHCRVDPTDRLSPLAADCTAHSAIFDPSTNNLRPLSIITDTWCSSGQFLPDGTLLQTGGDLDGLRKIRTFSPCQTSEYCDWVELASPVLHSGRWYATNQILPDGSVIIIGGRASPSVEFYPPSQTKSIRPFPFLAAVQDPQFDNLYPFVHLLPNGHLFVFANSHSILYNYNSGEVLREYPILEGGPRNYPSAGSSVMLALNNIDGFSTAEIVVCGGAEFGVFLHRETDKVAGTTCGRIVATDPNPVWEMELMPFPRVMGDMLNLPTGEVLIVNGAQAGSQGFEMASSPCLNPVLYRPNEPVGLRFMTLTPTEIPRMYHSTANLLPDGRVLVAGSNPHYFYKFDAEFPTELRLEAFSPEYLNPDRTNIRPTIETVPDIVKYGEEFEVEMTVMLPLVGMVEVNFVSAAFSTHSFSQGQRMVRLAVSAAAAVAGPGSYRYRIGCRAPPDGKVAPPAYYMVFVVNNNVPSVAKWVQLAL